MCKVDQETKRDDMDIDISMDMDIPKDIPNDMNIHKTCKAPSCKHGAKIDTDYCYYHTIVYG